MTFKNKNKDVKNLFIQSVRTLTVLIDVRHVKSGSLLSLPVKSGRFIEILWAFLIKQLFHSLLLDMR